MTIILILALTAAFVAIFIALYPPFGRAPSEEQRKTYQPLANFDGSKFLNQIPTKRGLRFAETLKVVFELLKGDPTRKPRKPLEIKRYIPGYGGETRVIWLGHSSIIVEIAGKMLLLDPMLGRSPSPFPFVGSSRYSEKLPFDIGELPAIDAVIISHDHYDHLDYGSIKRMKGIVKRFIVPLGVGAHLERWGVSKESIEEHGWGDQFEYEGLKLTCTPARHFSGRGVTGTDTTLWCSWIIDSGSEKIFFSGDSGYGPHFREIGNEHGPFDLTLIECGQYDERWAAIHMLPEEAVQAHLDVKGKRMIPIHWGAFTLAVHSWFDPAERVYQAAKQYGVALATPQIGEPVAVRSAEYPAAVWWK